MKITHPLVLIMDNLGIALNYLGNYTGAIAEFIKAATLDPKDDYATYGEGIALVGLAAEKHSFADLDLALQLLHRTLEINHANKDAKNAIMLIEEFFKYIHHIQSPPKKP